MPELTPEQIACLERAERALSKEDRTLNDIEIACDSMVRLGLLTVEIVEGKKLYNMPPDIARAINEAAAKRA